MRYFHLFLIAFFFLQSSILLSYQGEDEVKSLFSKIRNLKSPSYEEYLLIEDFLRNGYRPYLDPLYSSEISIWQNKINYKHPRGHHRSMRHLKLVGPEKEMPIFEIIPLRTSESDKENCILIYSSYNPPYPEKARFIVSELKNSGYKGHALLRIGGYPNMNEDGIKLCHIPYAFKVAFIKEAIQLGYENILWLDSSLRPIKDLSSIFELIKKNGYLLLHGGINLDFGYQHKRHLDNALDSLYISKEELSEIPHMVSCILGVNVHCKNAMNVINDWMKETQEVQSCISWYPEELPLSVVSWRHGLQPTQHWGNIVCTDDNAYQLEFFPLWNFILDLKR